MKKAITILPSYKCNNACAFCTNRLKEKTYRHASLKELKKYIKDEIKNSKNTEKTELVISGGEPLISKNLFKLMTFAKNEGISSFQIQTNGRMLSYKNTIKELKEFKPIEILVSFHFPTENLYKKYCGSNGFNQVIEGIKNLVKYNYNFKTNTVIMKPNLYHLNGIINLLKKEKVQKIQLRSILEQQPQGIISKNHQNVSNMYESFAPKFSEAVPIMEDMIEKHSNDINISIIDFPFCVLKKYKKNTTFLPLNKKYLFSPGIQTDRKESYSSQFIFLKTCENCFYFHKSACFGIPKEYVTIYGNKEFKPITS